MKTVQVVVGIPIFLILWAGIGVRLPFSYVVLPMFLVYLACEITCSWGFHRGFVDVTTGSVVHRIFGLLWTAIWTFLVFVALRRAVPALTSAIRRWPQSLCGSMERILEKGLNWIKDLGSPVRRL